VELLYLGWAGIAEGTLVVLRHLFDLRCSNVPSIRRQLIARRLIGTAYP
jgi:hypothetical protein